MKKILILLYIYQIIYASNFQDNINLTKEEQSWIKQHPTIKVTNTTNWPPFDFAIGNEAQGYSVDLLKLLAKRAGIKLEFINGYTWDELQKKFARKEIDVIHALYRNEHRERAGFFSRPYYSGKNIFIVRKDDKDIESIEDLKNKTIVIPKGWAQVLFLQKNYPDINLILTNNIYESIEVLSNGKADAMIELDAVASYYLKKEMRTELKISGWFKEFDYSRDNRLHYQVRNDWPILYEIFQKAFDSITPLEIDTLQRKWFDLEKEDINKLTQEEINYIKNNIFKRDYVDGWMPLNFFSKDGTNIGIAHDYWQLIKKKIGLKEQVEQNVTFNKSLKRLEEGITDLYPSTTKTNEREDFALFSIPYENYPIAIATKPNNGFLSNGSFLEGKIVAVGRNFSAYHKMKAKYPNIIFLQVENTKEAIKSVKNGIAYAAIDILPVLQYGIFNYGTNEVVFAGITDIDIPVQVIINKKHHQLLPILNKAIASISEEERAKIAKKWMQIDVVKTTDYNLMWKILLILGSVIFIVIVWNRSLRKKIEEGIAKYKEQEEENRKKDRILFQQSKLASMGEMINNIAHQWRQPLNEINSNIMAIDCHFMKEKIHSESLEKNLESIETQTKYMSETIDSFKNYVKPNKNKTEFLLSTSAQNSLDILKGQIKENDIKVKLNIKNDLEILGFNTEFTQVLIVILNNAIDALKLSKRRFKFIIITIDKNISIEDNAGGIKDEFFEKVFEPYFTTKMPTKGTGIGLYMAKMIIEDSMNGNLSVENTRSGARFTIKF